MSGEVGYTRPPVATRWKKGQSGNPSGKKKGTPNLKSDLVAELAEIIQINEGGASRRITKQRALLKALAARGIQGDARAANLMLKLIERVLEPEQLPPPTSTPVSPEDEAILEAYLQRQSRTKAGDIQ